MINLLALIWLGLIAFGVVLYVILDGFSLGIGIISIFFKDQNDKDIMVSTVLPVWDGNETWLVFVGATLYGAFPLAFSIILPALYIPILIMVIALLFRGASFEFRLKANSSKIVWNTSFFIGSLFATIAQGLILASLLTGFGIINYEADFSFHKWFNPFSLFCGFALIIGYAILGSNRLIYKTSGDLQKKCYCLSSKLQYILIFTFIIIAIWTPLIDNDIKQTWFYSSKTILFVSFFIISLGFFILHVISLKLHYEKTPYWSMIGLVLMAYFGLLLSIFPYIVPHKLTYIQAAADKSSLLFMLIGAIIMLPLLLFYTFYAYKIFSGKTHDKIEY